MSNTPPEITEAIEVHALKGLYDFTQTLGGGEPAEWLAALWLAAFQEAYHLSAHHALKGENPYINAVKGKD